MLQYPCAVSLARSLVNLSPELYFHVYLGRLDLFSVSDFVLSFNSLSDIFRSSETHFISLFTYVSIQSACNLLSFPVVL